MTHTKPIPDILAIPDSFRAEHLHHIDLITIIGIDEMEFWERYAAGLIPAGVPLLRAAGAALLCWPKSDIEAWLAAGQPANEELRDRTLRVYRALADAIEAEYGCAPEEIARLINERN